MAATRMECPAAAATAPSADSDVSGDDGEARRAPALAAHDVHIWTVDLRAHSASERDAPVAVCLLDEDERDRARRFVRDLDRHRFVAARSALRALASRYLAQSPKELRFTRGRWGKPELAGERLRFNVSHSNDFAVVAFTLDREIGVDIEWAGESLDPAGIMDLANVVCAPEERPILLALPGAARRAAFYRMWTRKEAFLKAVGRGLSQDPRAITVSFDDEGGLRAAPDEPPDEWTVASFPVPPGYVGAYAIRRRGPSPRLLAFDAGEELPRHGVK